MTLLENLEKEFGAEDKLLEHIKKLYSTGKIKLADMYEITNAFRIKVKDD